MNNRTGSFRVPPQAVEVERHTIGALLLADLDSHVAFEILKPEDFYLEKHKVIWEGMRTLAAAGQPIDLFTLPALLAKSGTYKDAGGEAYLMEVSSEVVSSANAAQHAEIIREFSQLRQLISGATTILEGAYKPGADIRQLLGEAESIILALAEQRVAQGLVAWDRITPGTLENVARANRGELTGVPTGLKELDRITGGLQPTDLIILAGRPAMGKTGLGLSLSWRSSFFHKKRGAFFSMEMGSEQLQQRVYCSKENLDLHKLRLGGFTQEQIDRFSAAVMALVGLPLYIDDQSAKTPLQILSQCKRMKAKGGLDYIVVDFCQLGRMDKEMENRQQEVGEFAYALKGIAKDLHVPVIGLAQLNRECDKRTGDDMGNVSYKLSDLNESGKLEQAADIVGVIHRPEVLSKKAETGLAQLQVIKFRNGPTGDIDLRFNAESASFSDYIPPSFLEGPQHESRYHGRSANSQSRSAPPRSNWGDAGPQEEPRRAPRVGEAGWDG